MKFPTEFDKPKNCLILRVKRHDKMDSKYLYYVFVNFYQLGTFKQCTTDIGKNQIHKNDLRFMKLNPTHGNTELEPGVQENLGDLISVLDCQDEVQENDIIMRCKGQKNLGEVMIIVQR